jgi:hypothetical protein
VKTAASDERPFRFSCANFAWQQGCRARREPKQAVLSAAAVATLERWNAASEPTRA